MRLTKFEHATFTVASDAGRVVVDPGSFTSPLAEVDDVVAVVLTHEHPDHWTSDHLTRILNASPDAEIFGPTGVAAAASDFSVNEVAPGDLVQIDGFELAFFGGRHNLIHSSLPIIDNVGVLINGAIYYPGDSYAVPPRADVEVLAAPIGAPWLRISDAMDFVLDVAPRICFGTHEATLSSAGLAMHRQRLAWASEQGGGRFVPLEYGEGIELDL